MDDNDTPLCCAICGQPFLVEGNAVTIRQSWIDAGGWGEIPRAAIVHPLCDILEKNRLIFGTLKLSDLWRKVDKTPPNVEKS